MNLVKKFKQAVSWTFLNNGNKVDYARRRISDGTPLHTTGLVRLTHDFRNVALLASVGIAYIASGGDLSVTEKVAFGSTLGLAFDEIFTRHRLRKEFNNKCINMVPKRSESFDFEDYIKAVEKRSEHKFHAAADALFFLFNTIRKEPDLNSSAMWAIWLASNWQQYRQFDKVTKGEWDIEGAPPPKKKEKKEKPIFAILDGLFQKPALSSLAPPPSHG